MRPPVAGYATLEFNKYDQISQVGYDYALGEIKKWKGEVAALGKPNRPIYRRVQSAEGRLSDLFSSTPLTISHEI